MLSCHPLSAIHILGDFELLTTLEANLILISRLVTMLGNGFEGRIFAKASVLSRALPGGSKGAVETDIVAQQHVVNVLHPEGAILEMRDRMTFDKTP